MCRKILLLISLVLVLGLAAGTAVADPNADPNLIGHWKMNESYWDGTAGEVIDGSGYDNNGRMDGDGDTDTVLAEGRPFFQVGNRAGDFVKVGINGSGHIDVPNSPSLANLGAASELSVALWIKPDDANAGTYIMRQLVGHGHSDPSAGETENFTLFVHRDDIDPGGDPNKKRVLVLRLRDANNVNHPYSSGSGNQITLGVWTHLAVVADLPNSLGDPNGPQIYFYKDGVLWVTLAADQNEIQLSTNLFRIGGTIGGGWPFDGLLDNVQVYDRALTAAEVNDVMTADEEELEPARIPSPNNGAKNVPSNIILRWLPGIDANSHDVYFGTVRGDVNDANTTVTLGVYKGNQALDVNNYDPTPSGNLTLGETYYWRIDEVNDVDPNNVMVWKGSIWKFTVIDFIYVDNFEQYVGDPPDNDPNLLGTWTKEGGTQLGIYGLWLMDGLGEPNHWGENSMRITYWNDSYYDYYSAGSRAPVDPNWTRQGVKALYLHFMGKADNPGDKFYVELEDTGSNVARLTYKDVNGVPDVNVVQLTEWRLWRIDLQDFVTVNPAFDLTNVAKLSIGIGEKGVDPGYAPTAEDYVYIDDIRLVCSRCLSDYPAFAVDADFNGDCMIDFKDLKKVVTDWLASDYTLTTSAPNDANMTGWWKFDDGTGSTALDSSVNGNAGTLYGDPNWVAGKIGTGALEFDPTDVNDYVKVADYNGITGQNSRTVAAWVKVPAGLGEPGVKWMNDIVSWGKESAGKRWQLTLNYGYLFLGVNGGNNRGDDTLVADGEWHHVAAVLENDGSPSIDEALLYVDGGLQSNSSTSTRAINTDPNATVQIGFYEAVNGDYFEGVIDDVRIYDFALSEAEVAWLAAEGAGTLYVPLLLRTANLYEDERIDFKDFAVLADIWLDDLEWP